jgi:RNA polymerase sigma-70 factor (ECF subfamily)
MSETSASLLERLSDRADSVAWQRLVDIYSPLIRSWLRRQGVAETDADDVSQEVLGIVVREFPEFEHNQRPGAFRAWLRAITTNCLRRYWRSRRTSPQAAGPEIAGVLDQLDDPASELSRIWDREHDQHVLGRLLEMIEPNFRPNTWQAFRRVAIEGAPVEVVAAELGLSVNAVLIAKSRVLQQLRRRGQGLID